MIINADSVIVDDSIFTSEEQDCYENFFLSSYFPWYLNKSLSFTSGENLFKHFNKISSNIFEYGFFVHTFVNNGQINSGLCDIPLGIFEKVREKYNFSDEIYRIKANLYTKISPQESGSHHTPHLDSYTDHIVLIYYVNDSDGDTFIFNSEPNNFQSEHEVTKIEIEKVVSPKKGRCLIFNGSVLHAGMHPEKFDNRIVINFNFKN